MIAQRESKAINSTGTEGARRATGVPVELTTSHPDPELRPSTKTRRHLTVGYKLKVIATVEELRTQGDGAIGAYLRKEGLYYATVHKWTKLQKQGLLTDNKPGPHRKNSQELHNEIAKLKKKLQTTEKKLKKTELVVELQKKLSTILGIDLPESSEES
jgi:hypothetical protein